MRFKAIEKLGERKGRTHTWTQVRIIFDTEDDPGAQQCLYVPNALVDEFIEFMSKGPAVVDAAREIVDNHFDPVFGCLVDFDEHEEVHVTSRVGKLWETLR